MGNNQFYWSNYSLRNMNSKFVKNRKVNPKSASEFNIFILIFLWLLLIFFLVFSWKFNLINIFFGEDLYMPWFSLCVLEIVFSFMTYKLLVLKFSKNKFLTILSLAIIPLVIFFADNH